MSDMYQWLGAYGGMMQATEGPILDQAGTAVYGSVYSHVRRPVALLTEWTVHHQVIDEITQQVKEQYDI